jgi:hypothetical protein
MVPSTFFNPNDDFTTTTVSSDTPLTIHPVRLDPVTRDVPPPVGFSYCLTICQLLRPGITASVAVLSGTPAVGTVTNGPFTFDHTTVNGADAVFHPLTAGSTTITIAQPAGFTAPPNRGHLVATVTPPPLTVNARSIGRNLQSLASVQLGAPAPAGNLQVTITSGDPSRVLVSADGGAGSSGIVVTVPAGSSSAPFYVQSLSDSGVVDVSASATGYASGSGGMTLHPGGFVLVPFYWCVACGAGPFDTTPGAPNLTFYLVSARLDPATLNYAESQNVRGGLSVPLTVSATANLGFFIPAQPFFINGGAAFENGVATIGYDANTTGTTVLEVQTPSGFAQSSNLRSITINVNGAALSVGDQSIGRNLQVAVQVALGEPAPAGGLDVTVGSGDAAKLLISADPAASGGPSALVHATEGQTFVTVYAQALSDTGTVLVTASAPGRSNGTATMTLAPAGFILTHLYWCVTCVPQSFETTTGAANTQLYVVAGRLNAGTGDFEISQNVRGGLSVDVTVSSTSTIGTNVMAMVPPTVTFTGGFAFESSVAGIQADPLNAGTAVLEVATPAGFSASNTFRTMTATVAGPALSLPSVAIGKDLQTTLTVSLQEPAPAGGVVVRLESADVAKVRISLNETTLGGGSDALLVPEGSNSVTFYVQALASSGTVALTATASGYSTGAAAATLQPSGFIVTQSIGCLGCFGVSFNTTTGSPNTPLDIVSARLAQGTLAFDAVQPVRAGGTVVVTVQSADSSGTNVGTITPPTVSFNGGVSVVQTAFDPVNPGVAIIEPLPPDGYSPPSTFRQLTANVSAPGITLAVSTVGRNLQTAATGTLAAPAPAGGDLAVTITSTDPARLTLATSPTDVGGPSIVLPVPAGSSNLPTFYLQALDGSGSVDIGATATGYTAGTAAVPLAPSGFLSVSPGSNFTTTTFAAPTPMAIYSAALNGSHQYLTAQPVRPGVTVNVQVTAADVTGTGVGTIIGSPVEFTGNEGVEVVSFDPAAVGTSVVTVVAPGGFVEPANFRVFTITVNAPPMFVGDALLGKDLQTAMAGSLGDTSPADVTVTITSTDPSKVLLSALPTTAGAASIVITATGPTNVIPAFYVQGLADSGTVTLNISAPNFLPTTAHVTLTPSGFIISSPASFTTQGTAANAEFQIASARLAPGTLTFQVGQPLRPGAAAAVNVTSTVPSVGAITLSPVQFTGNQGLRSTFFDPQPVAADGTTTVQISTPAGFSTPSQFQSVDATVQAVTIDPNATSNYSQWLLGAPAAPSVASFDEFATNTILTGNEYTSSGLTIVQRDGHPMRIVSPGDGTYVQAANFNSQPRGVSSSAVPGASFGFDDSKSENYDFVFAHPVLSAGLWIGNLNPGAADVVVQFLDTTGAVLRSYNANALDPNLVQGPGGNEFNNRVFVGLNATAPIAKIRVVHPANDADGVVFDDIVFNRAATTVIDFEDQPDNFGIVSFPASYRGVTWTNFLHHAPYHPAYQPGGVNAIYAAVDGARLTFPEQVFVGADFSRFPGTVGAIFFELYRSGTLVHTSAPFAGGGTTLSFLASGYAGLVDEVRVRSIGDAMTGAGSTWVMDNVSFIQTTTAGSLFLTPGALSQSVGSGEQMTVSMVNPLAFDLTVALSSSNDGVASVPASVVIPAGATSASFTVNGVSAGGALITASSTEASPARAVVAVGANVVEWISPASGNWSQGANWSTGTPPTAADVVRIDRPATVTVTVDASAQARTLFANEPVNVAGTLLIQEGAAFDRGFVLTGQITGAGRATARGSSTWTAGTLMLGGGLDLEAGHTLTIATGNEHRVHGSALRNHGTIVWTGGALTAILNATILNDTGGLFLAEGDRQISSDFSGGSNIFINAGLFRRTSGTGALTFGSGIITVSNTGTMEIQTGTVNAAVSFVNSGHLSVAAGAQFPLGNMTLNAGTTFSGAGVLKLNGGTTVNTSLTVPVALEMTGNVFGPGKITMTAPMSWISGIVVLGGGLDIEAGQTLTITTANEHRVQSSALRNRGSVVWNGGAVTATLNGTILNAPGGVWDAQGDRQIASDFSGGANVFTNAGLFRRTSGTGPLTLGGGIITFSNTGTMEIQTGTVNAAVAFTNSGTLHVAAGAEFPLANLTLNEGTVFAGGGLLKLNGATNVNVSLTIPLALEMTGNASGPGQMTMTAPMNWISGIMMLGGGLDIEAGQTLTLSTANEHRVQSSSLRNRGTVIWASGPLTATLNGTIVNAASGVWEVQGDRQLSSDFSGGINTFTNAGLLRRTSGGDALTFGGGIITFANTGTMEIQTGTVNAAVAFTNSGHLNVSAGASIGLTNFTLQAGSTFSGAGQLRLNGTTTVTGDLAVPVATEMTGNVGGAGKLTMTATLNWVSGTVSLEGGLDIEAGRILNVLSANDHRVQSSTLRNRGDVVWGSGTMSATLNGTILNEAGGIFDAQGSRQIASDFSGGVNTFTNAGVLRNSGNFGTLTIGGGLISFVNTGTIRQRITDATTFDRINVIGQATIGGTLEVFLVAGFVPSVTQVFTMMTFGSRVGTFAVINGNGHAWTPCYTNTSFTLGDPANGGFCAGL